MNGHSVGINLREGLIWDPKNAMELTLENLDKCCGNFDYSGVEQVVQIYFQYKSNKNDFKSKSRLLFTLISSCLNPDNDIIVVPVYHRFTHIIVVLTKVNFS